MKRLTLLGTDPNNPKFDKTKYVLQCRAVVSWMNFHKVNKDGVPYNYARGTVILPTGTGKSFVGLMATKKMQNLYKRKTKTIIIVPDSNLYKQWNSILKSLKIDNVEVYVINTVALGKKTYECDLLIVDEVHVSPGAKFRQIFTKVKYKFNLNLTATINRLDGLESFIKDIAPICFERTVKEAVSKGWIADSLTVNIPVFLNKEEEENLKSVSKMVGHYTKKFNYDFKMMQACMNSGNARTYALNNYPNNDPTEKPKEIVKWAIQGNKCVRDRREYLYNCEHKIEATVDLLNEFICKSITFSQSIKFANSINERMGNDCVVYHSDIPSEYRKYKKRKSFKTENGAKSFALRNNYSYEGKKGEGYIVSWFQKKKLSGKAVANDNINKYLSNKKRIISAARGLDKGFDCDYILFGIDAARTRSEIDWKQKRGRVTRNYLYKDGSRKIPVFVCLYIPNTTDEDWLRKAQSSSEGIVWCEDLDEAKEIIKSVLDEQIGKN